MRRAIAIIASSLLTGASLAQAEGGVVKWDIQKRQFPQGLPRIRRRNGTFEEIVSNEDARGGYFATCRLGTPGQDLTLQLDTGSSDIWVPDSSAPVCKSTRTRACDLGSCRALFSLRISHTVC